jgi:hypothetical protein
MRKVVEGLGGIGDEMMEGLGCGIQGGVGGIVERSNKPGLPAAGHC